MQISQEQFQEYSDTVKEYFEFRGLVMPDLIQASRFLATEVGELLNAYTKTQSEWVRNNPDTNAQKSFEDEFGDVLMMALVCGFHIPTTFSEPIHHSSHTKLSDDSEECLDQLFTQVGMFLYESRTPELAEMLYEPLLQRILDTAEKFNLNAYDCMIAKFTPKVFQTNV